MKIVIPGGTGHIGRFLGRSLRAAGHSVVVIGRSSEVRWDGRTLGPWAAEIDGCDVVINLAGRSVGCRYTAANLREMMDSRVDSARVVGEAIAQARKPPPVWLQMSTATIYSHRFDAPNDEATGVIGGAEPDVPAYWAYSVDIAKEWEKAQQEADTPDTRKVALRTAMVMSAEPGGIFQVLLRMVKLGIGGSVAGGKQYVSWIHEQDVINAVEFLMSGDIDGPVNLTSPNPVPQRTLMREIRVAAAMPVGIPATAWMAEIGAFVMRKDTELLLKSRRVVPGRLLDAGFSFAFPEWRQVAEDMVRRNA